MGGTGQGLTSTVVVTIKGGGRGGCLIQAKFGAVVVGKPANVDQQQLVMGSVAPVSGPPKSYPKRPPSIYA
jgi:hypothetical protein